MNIVVTLNCRYDYKKLQNYLEFLSKKNIKSIRLNLCKYPFDEYRLMLDFISKVLTEYAGKFDFILDMPYPKNKTRTREIKVENNDVIKDESYIITNSKKIFDHNENTIFGWITPLLEKISMLVIKYFLEMAKELSKY